MQQDKPKVVKQIITSAGKKHNIDLGKVTKINSNRSRVTETPLF